MQAIMNFLQRSLLWMLGGLLVLGMAGCGSEAKERAAFIAFLQTRIIDKPGVHVPTLTTEETRSFGDYSKHFDVITDYNTSMNAKVEQPVRAMMAKSMPRTMPDLLARRADVAALRKTSEQLRATIDTEQAAAGVKRVALKQPDDLRSVYDKAYARTVSDPGNSFKDFLVVMESMLASADKLADYLEQHRDQIRFNGITAEVDDQKVLDQMNVLMKELNEKNEQVAAAQRKLVSTVAGR